MQPCMIARRGFCVRGRIFVGFASYRCAPAAAQSSHFTARRAIPNVATTSIGISLLQAGLWSSVIFHSSGELRAQITLRPILTRASREFYRDALGDSASVQRTTLDPGRSSSTTLLYCYYVRHPVLNQLELAETVLLCRSRVLRFRLGCRPIDRDARPARLERSPANAQLRVGDRRAGHPSEPSLSGRLNCSAAWLRTRRFRRRLGFDPPDHSPRAAPASPPGSRCRRAHRTGADGADRA
jgi:hypothetical protein